MGAPCYFGFSVCAFNVFRQFPRVFSLRDEDSRSAPKLKAARCVKRLPGIQRVVSVAEGVYVKTAPAQASCAPSPVTAHACMTSSLRRRGGPKPISPQGCADEGIRAVGGREHLQAESLALPEFERTKNFAICCAHRGLIKVAPDMLSTPRTGPRVVVRVNAICSWHSLRYLVAGSSPRQWRKPPQGASFLN